MQPARRSPWQAFLGMEGRSAPKSLNWHRDRRALGHRRIDQVGRIRCPGRARMPKRLSIACLVSASAGAQWCSRPSPSRSSECARRELARKHFARASGVTPRFLPGPWRHYVLACGLPAAATVDSEDSADVIDFLCRDIGKIVIGALPIIVFVLGLSHRRRSISCARSRATTLRLSLNWVGLWFVARSCAPSEECV